MFYIALIKVCLYFIVNLIYKKKNRDTFLNILLSNIATSVR